MVLRTTYEKSKSIAAGVVGVAWVLATAAPQTAMQRRRAILEATNLTLLAGWLACRVAGWLHC